MRIVLKSTAFVMACLCAGLAGPVATAAIDEVVPFKFEWEIPKKFHIPASIRHTVPRQREGEPDIVYYFSPNQQQASYPIVVLCGGSYERSRIYSIFHLHRYFYKEFMDLGCGIVSAEEWGIDGHVIDVDVFMQHYTRTRRFEDYQILLDHFIANPPVGWNGKFVLFGISEGAQLVTRLTEEYAPHIRATIAWAAPGAWSWPDELWQFMVHERSAFSTWRQFVDELSQWIPLVSSRPATRNVFDDLLAQMMKNPAWNKEFMGMSYQYHVDACSYPLPRYEKLAVPFLSAAGGLDPAIGSFDEFVKKAQEAKCPITYVRVDGHDHYVRRCPEIVSKTFEWLKQQLEAAKQ